MIKIKDLNHLKDLCNKGVSDYFINLGLARSSKTITYEESSDTWYIYNEIDDSEDTLSSQDLFNDNYTNIGTALNNNHLYAY